MAFTSYSPHIALQPFVHEFFIFEHFVGAEQSGRKVVPPNDLPLLLCQYADLESVCEDQLGNKRHPHRCGLVGQQTKPHYITHIGRIGLLGVYLQPSGIFQLLGKPAFRFADKSTDLSLVFGNTGEFCNQLAMANGNAERIVLIENYLLTQLKVMDISLSVLHRAIAKKEASDWLNVSELAAKLGISLKQLQRTFKKEVGLSPQAYRKLVRFNRLVNNTNFKLPQDWQQLIYEGGYFDQAHLIRDFKSYTGKTPTAFLKDKEKFSFRPYISD